MIVSLFILVGAGGNVFFSWLSAVFSLPIFLDSIFTVAAGFILGPWFGSITGLGTGVLLPILRGLPLEHGFFVFPLVLGGLVAGRARLPGQGVVTSSALQTGFLLVPTYALIEAAILSLSLDGLRQAASDRLTTALFYSGIGVFPATLLGTLLLRTLDLGLSVLAAFGLYRLWQEWRTSDSPQP